MDFNMGGVLALFIGTILAILGFGKLNFLDKWKHQEVNYQIFFIILGIIQIIWGLTQIFRIL
jgi:hypothetical protein